MMTAARMTAVELDAFLRRGLPGQDVLAAAKLLKLGKRLAVGEINLLSGSSPDPIAHVTATYSIPKT